MNTCKLSFITGVYNEENSLRSRLLSIHSGLRQRFGEDFELIVIENGSTDSTKKVLLELASDAELHKKLRCFYKDRKGLGAAYSKGMEEALGNYVLLSAIDLPFGFSDIDQLDFDRASSWDIVFFSKAHRDSRFDRPISRKYASLVLNVLLRIFFNIGINDTQGSIIIRRSVIKELLHLCDDSGLFFTAQIGIYSKMLGLEILELPVVGNAALGVRKSKFVLRKDGVTTLFKVISEVFRYHRKSISRGFSHS